MNYFNYFSEIEETFIRRRGKSLLLSPLDWTLIESWQKRGIPQHIVIRSIEKIFDDIAKDPKRNPSVKSIAYCADEVERQFRDWQASQAGAAPDEVGEGGQNEDVKEEIVQHLETLIAALRDSLKPASASLKPALTGALAGLEKLSSKARGAGVLSSEKIEQELTVLESAVDKALLENAGENELAEAKKAVEEHLGQYAGKMQQDVYEKTFELMVIKKLRAKAAVPAFSLFYL